MKIHIQYIVEQVELVQINLKQCMKMLYLKYLLLQIEVELLSFQVKFSGIVVIIIYH